MPRQPRVSISPAFQGTAPPTPCWAWHYAAKADPSRRTPPSSQPPTSVRIHSPQSKVPRRLLTPAECRKLEPCSPEWSNFARRMGQLTPCSERFTQSQASALSRSETIARVERRSREVPLLFDSMAAASPRSVAPLRQSMFLRTCSRWKTMNPIGRHSPGLKRMLVGALMLLPPCSLSSQAIRTIVAPFARRGDRRGG